MDSLLVWRLKKKKKSTLLRIICICLAYQSENTEDKKQVFVFE